MTHWVDEPKRTVRYDFGCKAPSVLVPGVRNIEQEEEKARLNIKLCGKYFNSW